MSIKIDRLIFELEEEVTIPVSKQCQLLQSYYVVVSRLLGNNFFGGEVNVKYYNTWLSRLGVW